MKNHHFKAHFETAGVHYYTATTILHTTNNDNCTSYPGASLREGIINAICHADYSLPSNIKVEFFRDKVRIINPGNVYNSTLEAVLGGVQTFRNPALVNVLYKLGFIENYGTGLQRIREAYENEEMKPEFKVIDRYFFLTLPNLNKNSYSFDANDAKNDAKNETQKTLEEEIIDLIKNNNSISKIKMAMKTGKSKATIERLLKRSKVINHVGPKNGGHWEIVDENKQSES